MSRGTPAAEKVTIRVPFRVVKRGERKEMNLLNGFRPDRKADKCWSRRWPAFRCKRMLEPGEFATIAELAERVPKA